MTTIENSDQPLDFLALICAVDDSAHDKKNGAYSNRPQIIQYVKIEK